MNIRVFFLNGKTVDVEMETYYPGVDNQVLIIPVNGMPYTLKNVDYMIKIKD